MWKRLEVKVRTGAGVRFRVGIGVRVRRAFQMYGEEKRNDQVREKKYGRGERNTLKRKNAVDEETLDARQFRLAFEQFNR